MNLKWSCANFCIQKHYTTVNILKLVKSYSFWFVIIFCSFCSFCYIYDAHENFTQLGWTRHYYSRELWKNKEAWKLVHSEIFVKPTKSNFWDFDFFSQYFPKTCFAIIIIIYMWSICKFHRVLILAHKISI